METNRHFTMHLAKPNVLSPTSVILIIRSPHGIWSSTNSQMGLEQVFSPQDCFSHEIKASEHLGSQHTCLNSAPSPTGCMTLSKFISKPQSLHPSGCHGLRLASKDIDDIYQVLPGVPGLHYMFLQILIHPRSPPLLQKPVPSGTPRV